MGWSLQTLLPPGVLKEHTMSQTVFLGGEVRTAKAVPGCKPSHEVVLNHKDHQWGRRLKGKEAIH